MFGRETHLRHVPVSLSILLQKADLSLHEEEKEAQCSALVCDWIRYLSILFLL